MVPEEASRVTGWSSWYSRLFYSSSPGYLSTAAPEDDQLAAARSPLAIGLEHLTPERPSGRW